MNDRLDTYPSHRGPTGRRLGAYATASLVIAAAVIALIWGSGERGISSPKAARELFDVAIRIVQTDFYDKSKLSKAWQKEMKAARSALGPTPTLGQAQGAVNYLLDKLKTSHTHLYSRQEPMYWAQQSVFSGEVDRFRVDHIGAWFTRRGGGWYVNQVLDGSPAAEAGLRYGDRIVTVDRKPLQPVDSFRGKKSVALMVRRHAWDPPFSLQIKTVKQSWQRAFLAAMRLSEEIKVSTSGRKIGYVHLWAGTHPRFRDAFVGAIERFRKANVAAIVVDLRGGLAGAHPDYAEPLLNTTSRSSFHGPIAMLVDQTTRGGKEWLAYTLRQAKRALFIGEQTAGAVRTGKFYSLADRHFALLLAVKKPNIAAAALEGVGFKPDATVARPLVYAAGADPPYNAAIKRLDRRLARR